MAVNPPAKMPMSDPPAWRFEELHVTFQPVFALSNGLLSEQAACLGYSHPQMGLIQGRAVHDQAEDDDQAKALSQLLLVEAVEQYIKWRGTAGPGLCVDLTPANMTDPEYPEFVQDTLRQMGLSVSLMTLNCSPLPEDLTLQEANRQVQALKLTGVRLSLEVTGRAGHLLKNIHPFPFDEIKASSVTVVRALKGARGSRDLSSMLEIFEIAKSSGAQTIATGVGDIETLRAVTGLGFSGAQGDFLAPQSDIQAFAMNKMNDVRMALGLERYSQQELVGALSAVKRKNKKRAASSTPDTIPIAAKEGEALPSYRDQMRRQLRKRLIREDDAGAGEGSFEGLGRQVTGTPLMVSVARPRRRKVRRPISGFSSDLGGSSLTSTAAMHLPLNRRKSYHLAGQCVDEQSGFSVDKGKIISPVPYNLLPRKYPTAMRLRKDGSIIPLVGQGPIRLIVSDDNDNSGNLAGYNPYRHRIVTSRNAQAAILRNTPTRPTKNTAHEELALPPVSEADMMSEDEILDAFLKNSQLLDPAGPDGGTDELEILALGGGDDAGDDDILVDISPQELAMVRQIAARKRPRRRKNFLQRRYKITHFWPRSWYAFFAD